MHKLNINKGSTRTLKTAKCNSLFTSKQDGVLTTRKCNQYRDIFGSSGEEDGSDIDFEGFSIAGESDEEPELMDEDEESTDSSDGKQSDKEKWSEVLKPKNIVEFSGNHGILINFGENPGAENFFWEVFGEETPNLIVEETNRYARQILTNKQQLEQWLDLSSHKMKAFLCISVIMGINILPNISDYWSNEPFPGNDAIKRVMPRNRYQEISQFLHFSNLQTASARGDASYCHLYKVHPTLTDLTK